MATPAAASPDPATGTTTALSVLGADDAGEAALTYTWSTVGTPPAAVTFSANGTNAAKNTTASFTKAGSYDLQVVIRDAGSLTAASPVTMTVSQTLTSIVVTPASASVVINATQQFSATARDQFATALTSQPSFSWMVSGGGTISASGLFTAGGTPGGPFTVTATSGAVNGTAQVTVTSGSLAAPSNLTAATSGASTVSLSWMDNSSNETGFRVERKVNAGSFLLFTTVGVNVQAASDTTVTAGNTYTYRVIATGSPNSGPSNEVVAMISSPAADAYVRSGTSAGTNFGTAATVEVKHTNTTTTRRNGFLRFNMAGVQTNVLSAKLRIYGNAVTTAKLTSVHSVSDITWSETGITWNYPTTDAGGPAMSGTPLQSLTVGLTPGYTEFDVTAYVQARKSAGATAITLGLKSGVLSDDGPSVFQSRESTTAAQRPVLVISSRP